MKIGILGARNYPPAHGGLEIVAAELAHALHAEGHELYYFSNCKPHAKFVVNSTFSLVNIPALGGKYTRTVRQMLGAIKQSKKFDLDVLIIHGAGPALFLVARRFLIGDRRKKVLTVVHGADWRRVKWPFLARWVFRTIARVALRQTDALIAVSRAVSAHLEADLAIHNTPVIPNAVSLPPARQPHRISFNAHNYALVVTRITPEKDILTIIEAWRQMERSFDLVIAGGSATSYTGAYEKRCRDLAGPNVHFLGALPHPEVRWLLDHAQLFISASTIEGMPVAVLEAAALGLPMLLSDIPEHEECAPDWAQFFKTSVVQSLGEQLRLHLLNLRRDRGGEPCNRAFENLQEVGWEKPAKAYSNALKNLMQGRPDLGQELSSPYTQEGES